MNVLTVQSLALTLQWQMTWVDGVMQGRDINLDIQRVVSYRHWCNKLWNAIKFGMLKLKGFEPVGAPHSLEGLPFACAWILDRLNLCTTTVIKSMESYDFSAAATVSLSN